MTELFETYEREYIEVSSSLANIIREIPTLTGGSELITCRDVQRQNVMLLLVDKDILMMEMTWCVL